MARTVVRMVLPAAVALATAVSAFGVPASGVGASRAATSARAAVPAHAVPAHAVPAGAPAAGLPTAVKQPVATGTGGAVASADADASQAGIEVLRRGGNAVDAAVAVASTLGVTEPFVAGPGGGGYMVIYLAATGQVVTIDGRETCPAGCTPRRFVDPATGGPLDFELARHSGISVGVPGMVATWADAVRRYGRASFAQVLQPAIARAEAGFVVDEAFRSQEASSLQQLRAFPASRQLFLTRTGDPLPDGSVLKNPDLANTYRTLAAQGPSALYTGSIGQAIAQTVQHPQVSPDTTFTVLPGDMTTADLAAYRTKDRAPTKVSYRGYDVYGMGPSSSGGTTVGEALNILSGYRLGRTSLTESTFRYLEASRLAFADRNAYVGDIDYEDVPLQQLLSPAFAASRRCLIGSTALTSPVAPGNPYAPSCGTGGTPAPTTYEGDQTNHLVTADRWGNVVSYTNTIEQLAGSGMTVPGHGFLLNNEMTDFDFAAPTPGVHDPNLPAPGKRPRSSMSPTIALRDGKPAFAIGSPGGATIITTVLQVLLAHVDLGLSLPDAIAAPRATQRNAATTSAEPEFYDTALRRELTSRYGEQFTRMPDGSFIGNATGLDFLPDGRVEAAAEPVRSGGGSAMVVDPS